MRNSLHSRRRRHCHYYHFHHDQQQCHDKLIPELSGAIFMCNNETRNECFSRRILGLPACRERFVRQVKDGMFLFLFDTDDRKMFGVFKATSDGGMNIVPEAYSSSGSSFPAQVQFEIIRTCKPLTEPEFKPAILKNYFTAIKFNFGLNFDQVQRLLDLFEEKKVSQTINKRIRNSNPNTEAAIVFLNSDMNSPTPRNINLGRQIDMNVVRTQTRICHTGACDTWQYRNDPAQQGVQNASSPHLAQQMAQFVYCTGTGNCAVCAQKMIPDMAYNSCLPQQIPCGLHANPDYQQVTLSAHNHSNLSPTQAAQLYAPNPYYPENIEMTVFTCSDFYGGSQLQDQVHNSGSQDVEQKKSVFLRLARNPKRKTWKTESRQTCAYPTMNQPDHHMQQLSHRTGSRAARRTRPVYNRPAVQYQEPVRTNGLAGSYTVATPDTATEVDGIDLDPTAPVSNSTLWPGETQVPVVNFKRINEGSKLGIERKGDLKKTRIFRRLPMNAFSEAEPDPDVVDGMEVHPIASSSNLTVEHSEVQIPFVNFNRRNRIHKLGIEPKGDNEKRRLIRPSLLLEDRSSHLQVHEGPMQVAIDLNEPLIKPSLSSTEFGLDGKSMVIADATVAEARVGSKNSELLQGTICRGTEVEVVDIPLEGFQGNHGGERVLLSGIGIENERGHPDLGTSTRSGSFVTSLDQRRDECNETSVSVENERKKLKQDLKEFKVFPFISDICLDKLPETSKVETGHVAETSSDSPQMILVSGSEKSDASKFNETGVNISEDQTELLVIEKTDKKKSVSNPEVIDSQPITEINDNSILEHPYNSKISLCLDNEESNLVEDCINLERKANNLKTSLISHMRNGNPVEEHITFEQEADLKMVMFSFSQSSFPVEDYTALE